ncbi:MAG: signal peptidase II [Reyranellaceae bacterium]
MSGRPVSSITPLGRRMLRLGLLFSLALIVADQLTKFLVMAYVLPDSRAVTLTPFLNFVVVWNRGVSFGLFSHDWGGAPWVLSALAVAIVVLLCIWLTRARRGLTALALGAVIGGAIGNVIDRARFGAVYDFVDLHYAGWHWPAFNLADSAITLGVVALLVDSLLFDRQSGH